MMRGIFFILFCLFLNVSFATNKYSYLAAIFEQETNIYICAGTIIRYDWILTSGRAVAHFYPKYLYVRVGGLNSEHGGQVLDVVTLVTNKELDVTIMATDVALVGIGKQLELTPNVAPIKMEGRVINRPPAGINASVIGFERSLFEPLNQKLKVTELNLYILNEPICQRKYMNYNINIDDDLFCLDTHHVEYCDCFEDIGGPVVYSDRLIGILTWRSFPLIIHRIDKLSDWIEYTMQIYASKNI